MRDISIPPKRIPAWKQGERPKHIYHYTNPSGLMGIINSKSLWATDVWYMNDTGEATYAIEAIKKFVGTRRPDPGAAHDFCERLKRIFKVLDSRETLHHYIACLSENGDQLSQWRAYGSGRGFSIGFDLEALYELFAPPSGAASVSKVIYDETLQQAMLLDIFKEAEAVLHAMLSDGAIIKPPEGFDAIGVAATGFFANSMILSTSFKHPAFCEEAEVRIHTNRRTEKGEPAGDVKFRESALGVTPYITIPLRPPGAEQMSVIREVIIGPQSHQREVQRAIGQFLAANGLSDVKISLSKVPLRA